MTEGAPVEKKQKMNTCAKAEKEPSIGAGDAQNIANNTNEDKKEEAVENIMQELVEMSFEETEEALKERRRQLKLHLEAAVSVLITEITAGFKDFTFPVKTLYVLGNRMHYVIYSRIVGMDMGDLLELSVSIIVRNYRRRFTKEGDILFMIQHFYKIQEKQAAEAADIANANVPVRYLAAAVDAPQPVDIERQNEDAVNPPGPSAQ